MSAGPVRAPSWASEGGRAPPGSGRSRDRGSGAGRGRSGRPGRSPHRRPRSCSACPSEKFSETITAWAVAVIPMIARNAPKTSTSSSGRRVFGAEPDKKLTSTAGNVPKEASVRIDRPTPNGWMVLSTRWAIAHHCGARGGRREAGWTTGRRATGLPAPPSGAARIRDSAGLAGAGSAGACGRSSRLRRGRTSSHGGSRSRAHAGTRRTARRIPGSSRRRSRARSRPGHGSVTALTGSPAPAGQVLELGRLIAIDRPVAMPAAIRRLPDRRAGSRRRWRRARTGGTSRRRALPGEPQPGVEERIDGLPAAVVVLPERLLADEAPRPVLARPRGSA